MNWKLERFSWWIMERMIKWNCFGVAICWRILGWIDFRKSREKLEIVFWNWNASGWLRKIFLFIWSKRMI